MLHSSFNTVQNYYINISLLEEILRKHTMTWKPFLKAEFISFIDKCNNSLTSELDKLSWKYFKSIIKNNAYLRKIINIADTYFELGHWLVHFKVSTFIIIPKPNKELYNSLKAFRLIILLNTINKLIEKVISKRLQFQLISKNFIHLYQLNSFK